MPFCHHVEYNFRGLKNDRRFKWLRTLGEGICDTIRVRGELERPGRLLEAVLGLQGSIGVLEAEINTPLCYNATVALNFKFYEGVLRVGITKYCKLQ